MARSIIGVASMDGMEVGEAKRLRELEFENAKLKKLLAEKLLEVEAMKHTVRRDGISGQPLTYFIVMFFPL